MGRMTKIIMLIVAAVAVVCTVAAVCADEEPILTGAGEDASAIDMISLMIPEEVAAVTAEGNIGDLLVPRIDAAAAEERDLTLSGDPVVMIYHTHTTEAYRQVDGAEYEESGSWRTKDEDNNIIAVGEVLKTELESYGFTVMHDTTDHEPPKLTTAYDRSLVTMEKYLKEYPEIDLFIDLHRDARASADYSQDFVTVDGKECAKLMFVVGKGENFEVAPDFERNYSFAYAVNEELTAMNEDLAREICIKSGRYNQHIGPLACLIEVGHNMNTLEQAKNSAALFAKAISNVTTVENK